MSPLFQIVSFCLIHLALIAHTTASPKNIWHVSIWEAPAPPPGKGPPIAKSALRDPSYLPAQISAIVGAYVFSVLVIGSAILFVGRRLRRGAQASPQSLAIEMMKPVKTDFPKAFDPSPISPSKSQTLYGQTPESNIDMKNNWPSPNKSARNSGWGSISKGHKKQAPSVQSSVVTFDESVIEDDKERNQKEMERLYAAVMDHDEKKSASAVNLAEGEQGHAQNPPELQHLRSSQQGSIDHSFPPPRSDTKSPARTNTKSPRTSSRPTPLSLHSRNSSRSSFGSFSKRRGIRNIPISPPMGSPDLIPDHNDAYGDTEPLTPRIYDDPGPPPPTPPQQRAMKSRDNVMDSTRLSPQSARFPEQSFRVPRVPAFPGVQPIPESGRPNEVSQERNDSNVSPRETSKSRKTPAPLALRTQALSNSNSQRSPLPQKQQHNPLRSAPLPLRQPHPTNYNADRPPSMIKATVLERKVPNTSLRTPATGVPQTPYSPYMPYTPLTPMTPSRLVTKEERKKRGKEEGRRVATIDDAVQEEPDMWGDAYP
ncbi:hypothetical protein ACLMJK_005467 [Lecanora helva]